MIDGAINQDPVWPITRLKLAADEVLMAVADRVSTNNVPPRTGRMVLEELAKAGRVHPEWLQERFIANRYLRHMQAQVSEQPADKLKQVRN